MKAFFVTNYTDDTGYNICEEVEGKDIKECVIKGIQAFDKECIYGEPRSKKEIICDTALLCVRDEKELRRPTYTPYIARFFSDSSSRYMKANLIFINKNGELVKRDVFEEIKEYFASFQPEIKKEIDRLKKEERKKEYEALKEEFEAESN